MPTVAPQTIVYEVMPPVAAAPVTAMPVYGNIVNQEKPVFIDRVTPASSVGAGGTSGTAVARTAGTSTGTLGSNPDSVQFSDATITVGTATINVLSSFKLNYGGKTILTGNNGQTSSTQ